MSAGTAGHNTGQGNPRGRRAAVAWLQGDAERCGAQRLLLLPPDHRPPLRCSPRALTDEENGEGDEEQEDVRHHVERVHEATVVEDALVHPVGGRVVLAAAEGQGHGGAGSGSGSNCGWLHAPPALCPL